MNMPSERVWWQPAEILEELRRRNLKEAVLYYELAPTGSFHPGLLRTSLQIQSLKDSLNKAGLAARCVLRLNDRYVLRSIDYSTEVGGHLMIPLTMVPSPIGGHDNFCQWSINDICAALEACDCKFDEVRYVSELYDSQEFKDLAADALLEKDSLLRYIGDHQQSRPSFFSPVCPRCSRMYAGFTESMSGQGVGIYRCSACELRFRFDVLKSPGLINFKIETALTWRILGVSVDVHGTDQRAAARVSAGVYKILFQDEAPLRHCVNCVLGSDGKIMHKSRRNFRPVLSYSPEERTELIRVLGLLPVNSLVAMESIERRMRASAK